MDSNFIRTLKKELHGWRRLAILGIGNELGGDDSLGLLAARKIKQMLPDNLSEIDVMETAVAPENFTGALKKSLPSHVILIDAAEMGEKAGFTTIINPDNIQELVPSTHSLPLSTLAKYIKMEVGSKVIILGIQPKEITFSTDISPEVKAAVNQLTEVLIENLVNRELCHEESR